MKRLTASWAHRAGAAGRLTAGSHILTDRITAGAEQWVRAGRRDDLDGWRNSLGPLVRLVLLVSGIILAYLTVRAMPWLMWPLAALWCRKAWRAPSAAPNTDCAEPDAADNQEQPGHPPAVDLTKPAVPDREQLTAALHQVADPHAHLASLARALRVDTAAVREGLAQAGIPTTGGCREEGRVSTGVKREHFPPPPTTPGTPVVADETAGHPDNNGSNNNADGRRPYRTREGFWITPDPERPHGWNVAARRS
jgi:hypothetical protein